MTVIKKAVIQWDRPTIRLEAWKPLYGKAYPPARKWRPMWLHRVHDIRAERDGGTPSGPLGAAIKALRDFENAP